MTGKKSLAAAVADYGADTKAKLASPTVTGAPEDQLRNPLENLFKELAELAGYPPAPRVKGSKKASAAADHPKLI